MRNQGDRSFETRRMQDTVVNPCSNEEKESKWGAIGWRVDKTGQPCSDVENQWACELALDGFVLGHEPDACAQGRTRQAGECELVLEH